MFQPNVLERGTLDFWGSKFSRKSVHISGWGHRNVPPKKYFPQIFFLEIGGGSKHVLGRGRQSEGITCFLKKNSPLDLGKYFEKKMFFFILMLHVWKIAKNLPLHLESLGWTRSTAVVAENKRTSDVVVLPLFLGAVLTVKVGVIRQISLGQWEIAVFAHLKKKHQISENRHRGQISGHKGQRSKSKCVGVAVC